AGSVVGAGSVAGAGEAPKAGAHSVVSIWVGNRCCPSSRRRFHTHWLTICQNSCPQGVWEHQRSGSCSLSSSARTVSKDPRCRYRSSTSLAEKAGAGSLVTNNSKTMPPRFFPIDGGVDVAG